jgi:hypothetical protein
MMLKEDSVTKIVNSKNGEAIALCLLTSKLEELDWVNPKYYKDRFPDRAATDQIVWFPGLAADPTKTVGNLRVMVNLIAELMGKGNNEALVVFDCCDKNTGFLDIALNTMINKTPQASINIKPFATQTYGAIRLSLK